MGDFDKKGCILQLLTKREKMRQEMRFYSKEEMKLKDFFKLKNILIQFFLFTRCFTNTL